MGDFISDLFSLRGRVSRSFYWGIQLCGIMIYVPFVVMDENSSFQPILGIPLVILCLLFIWINIATNVKRWHDRNKSGFWMFIGVIPIIGPIWALVECGFLPGTEGPNNYGKEPT